MKENIFYKIDGVEYCDDELALSTLLDDGVLFCNTRDYSTNFEKNGKEGHTTVLFVICNDIFAWGCADGEDLPANEISNLYKMWEKDKIWGAAKWCCYQRNLKPQKPVEDAMRKAGVWDESMNNLKDNKSS